MQTRITADRRYKKTYGEDKELMTVNLCLPFVEGMERADTFYEKTINSFLSFCEGKILKKAAQCSKNEDFAPFGAVLKYTKSFEDDVYLSIFTDAYVYDGKRKSNILRCAQVWRKSDGQMARWREVVNRGRDEILASILIEAETQQQEGVSAFYADYKKLIERHFNPKNFYLVPSGIAFFYDAQLLNNNQGPQVFVIALL